MPAHFRKTLPVALPLVQRSVLIIGGDLEALDKAEKLVRIGAHVTVVAECVEPGIARLARQRQLLWYARSYQPTDLSGAHLVLLTLQDEALAQALRALKPRYGFWLCALDQPAYSDIHLVSIVRRGPLQIGISTGGAAPLLARRIRQALEAAFDQGFGEFAHGLAELRSRLRVLTKEERKLALEQALGGFAMDVRVSYPASSRAEHES